MITDMHLEEHLLGRPPAKLYEVERWTGRVNFDTASELLERLGTPIWVPDDGKPGLAFSGLIKEGFIFPMAYFGECHDLNCIVHRMAMERTVERFKGANGEIFDDFALRKAKLILMHEKVPHDR